MKLATFLLLVGFVQVSANTYSQNEKYSLKMTNANIREVLAEIQRNTEQVLFFSEADLNNQKMVNLDVSDVTLNELLEICLKGTDLTFEFKHDAIILKKKEIRDVVSPQEKIIVSGIITDVNGGPIPGANVILKEYNVGTITDGNGYYELSIPEGQGILIVSFIGFEKQEIAVNGQEKIDIVLKEMVSQIEDVVITGIYERKKESFTGSAVTISGEELMKIGNTNIVQSLKTLDPSFIVMENNQFGSDPNKLPEVQMRGSTSLPGLKDEYGINPNQPLYIMDGFETTLSTIIDLDPSRVQSITLLKDAASTAIYGSKAANGVLVVETVKPKSGELRVSYKGDFRFSFPDLSDYNLMNAEEKLEFERLGGLYTASWHIPEYQYDYNTLYNERLAEVKRGVDTYWMNEPLRTGFSQRHSVYLDGGSNTIQTGMTVNYDNKQGVMIGSSREVVGGAVDVRFRKNKVKLYNKFFFSNTKTEDSPYGSFSNYSRANPYFRKQADHELSMYLYEYELGYLYGQIPNPLYDAAQGRRSEGNSFMMRNNTQFEYEFNTSLKAVADVSITKSQSENISFDPPTLSKFDDTPQNKKGEYYSKTGNGMSYSSQLRFVYGKTFHEKHLVNVVLGGLAEESTDSNLSHTVVGFPGSNFDHPMFARGYEEGGRPSGSDSKYRSLSTYSNFHYSYDNRYLMDLSYRYDGSSVFGSKNKFVSTWGIGLAWNISNEAFLKDKNWLTTLKLRGSVGTPKSQSFSAYQSVRMYEYITDRFYGNNVGSVVQQIGNEDLLWQTTLDKNLGLDLVAYEGKLGFNVDVYHKETDNLIVPLDMPISVGYPVYTTNMGKMDVKGIEFKAMYTPLRNTAKRFYVNLTAMGTRLNSTYKDIDGRLEVLNEKNVSENLIRYRDGASTTDIWGIRSAGIDPATGSELFYKADNTLTFDETLAKEVVIGNSNPDLQGVIGANVSYQGFTASIHIRYSFGADIFNSELMNKIENVNYKHNQDKRALYDRWHQTGDVSQFKALSVWSSKTPYNTSRFIQEENYIKGESIALGYEMIDGKVIDVLGLSRLSFDMYLTDIFRISSIKRERGIDYPYAYDVSFSVKANF